MDEEATFSVIHAKRNGRDSILIIDTALNPDRLCSSFSWLLIIALPIARPNDMGLCDKAESDRLSDIEDDLLNSLSTDQYCYMGRSTWNKIREVFIYVGDPDRVRHGIQEQVRNLAAKHFDITINQRYEPNWDTYRKIVGQAQES